MDHACLCSSLMPPSCRAQVQISGPKSGAPPPPAIDMGALAGFLGALGQPDGRDLKNR